MHDEINPGYMKAGSLQYRLGGLQQCKTAGYEFCRIVEMRDQKFSCLKFCMRAQNQDYKKCMQDIMQDIKDTDVYIDDVGDFLELETSH